CLSPSYSTLQVAIILSPYLWKTCIMGTPITSWSSTRDPRSIAPMNEPTQDLIVSELRRRVSVSIAELTQVLGLQFASILPQEIQRMKASGMVVYEEPLGLYSVEFIPLSFWYDAPLTSQVRDRRH